MGVGTIHTRELDKFVAECDRLGGIATPEAAKYVEGFGLRYDTRVDPSLDPFSDAYFAQQRALYTELAGRELDQETGEQTPLDATANVGGSNPYTSRDVGFIAKHARVIHTCLMMADRVLQQFRNRIRRIHAKPPSGSGLRRNAARRLRDELCKSCSDLRDHIYPPCAFSALVARLAKQCQCRIPGAVGAVEKPIPQSSRPRRQHEVSGHVEASGHVNSRIGC